MTVMNLNVSPVVKGALTFIPGFASLLPERAGETDSARYCYGAWLKHLVMLHQSGARTPLTTLVELGPGRSLGTGLAAMLCGVNHYYALDVVQHASIETNLRIFDELVEMFQKRAPRPAKSWPDYDAHLDARLFPVHILTDEVLKRALTPQRIANIRNAIVQGRSSGPQVTIQYIAPWADESVIAPGTVDLVLSHAVLARVADPAAAYRACYRWLKPGGAMSHQIGFAFPAFTGPWNGYWACPEPLWRIFKGRRPFVMNRLPCSAHLSLMEAQGFRFACKLKQYRDGVPRSQLAAQWRTLSDDDLRCSGLFVQATK
ncbi:MAG TPA: methyltransferase domain-containing protein [Burkholderiales bacterium]